MRPITKWLSAAAMTAVILAASLLFSSYKAEKYTDEMWKLLGITRQSGTEGIKNSFLNGYLYCYGARNAKNIAVNDRTAIANDLLIYTKEYISSADFKKQYETMRQNAKPVAPVEKKLRTKEEVQKEEIAKSEKTISETEKNIKEMTPEMKKTMQPVLDMLKQNLKDYRNINNPYFDAIVQGEKYDQENNRTRYEEDSRLWEKNYPAAINEFVADKLTKMLEYTKDIDYNAALVEKYGKKRFVNATYEGKRMEWKQGFRAGKNVTETAREFAKKWLAELK